MGSKKPLKRFRIVRLPSAFPLKRGVDENPIFRACALAHHFVKRANLDLRVVDSRISDMKLSLRGEYAVRALLVLGLEYQQPVVSIQNISNRQNIPKRFLEQILADLKSAGFVTSKRGIAGGYRLARPPEQITLASVVRHIEGALAPVSCVSERFYEKCSCPDESRCAIRSVMKEIREAVVKIAERVTIAELCRRYRDLQQVPVTPFDFSI